MKTMRIGIIGIVLAVLVVSVTVLITGQSCNPMDIFLLNSLIILEVTGIAVVFSLFLLMKSSQEKYAGKAKKALKRR